MILGIDQGTTSTKAYLAAADGMPRLIGRHVHRQLHSQPGWVEHDPDELLQAIRDLIVQAGPCDFLGLANQGETVVAWDAVTKRPLHNAIVWQDDRTRPEIARLRVAGVEALTLARAGLPLDAYFSASKLRWLLDHAAGAAELHRAGRLRLGTSDAFFIDCLTGRCLTDVTTASRTSLANLASLQWDADLCAVFGVPMDCLPEIVPSAGSFGTLPGSSTELVAGIVDQQAALYGHGCDRPGDVKITFGTGAFALGLAGDVPPQATPGLIATCAWGLAGRPAQYAAEASLFTAGAALEWLDRIGMRDGIDALQPGRASACESGVMFVPAQAGLGSPYWDRSARALWIGMDLATTREQLALSVLEGVALRAAQVVPALTAAIRGAGRVRVDGGLSHNAYFTDFLAAALGREIAVSDSADMTAWGVIRLCRTAAGLPEGPPPLHRIVTPRRTLPRGCLDRFADAVERARGWV